MPANALSTGARKKKNALMRSQARPSQMTARRPRDDFDYDAQLRQLMSASGEGGEVGNVLRAPPEWGPQAGNWMLRQTGSPLLATATEMVVDPLNFIPGGKAAAAVPIGIGAVRGMKRVPPLYHGTENPNTVLQQGLRRGASAELKTPGSSLSSDPTVSMRFAVNEPQNVLRVTPDVDPSQVRNLSFGEYMSGVVPGENVFNKPNAAGYQEAEMFLRRMPAPGTVQVFDDPVPVKDIRALSGREQMSVSRQADEVNAATSAVRNLTRTDLQSDAGAALGVLSRGVTDTKGNRGAFEKFMNEVVRKIAPLGGGALPEPVVQMSQAAYQTHEMAKQLGSVLQDVGRNEWLKTEPGELADYLRRQKQITPDSLRRLGLWKRAKDAGEDITQQDLIEIANNAQRAWVKQRNQLADELQRLAPMGGGFERPARLRELRNRNLLERR